MDNLVLARVAADLSRRLFDAVFEDLRQDGADRFALTFEARGGRETLAVSTRSANPWIGLPARRREGPAWSPDGFVAEARRKLRGRRLAGVAKPPADRSIVLSLAGGVGLAIELTTHGANLVLLGSGDEVVATFRRARSTPPRLEIGARYAPRGLPADRIDPWSSSAEEIDRRLADTADRGGPAAEALARRVLGIGASAARLVVDEARATGRSRGEVLRAHLAALERGEEDPILEAPEPPLEAVARGTFDTDRFALWPWTPREGAGRAFRSEGSPAATAGLFHEALEAAEATASHVAGLRAILDKEIRKTRRAAEKVAEEASSFEDADRYGRHGEALLAGLTAARRHGNAVVVPDPYDPEGGDVVIEAPAGRPLTQVASDLFTRQRRARRGREAARERSRRLADRADRLDAVRARHALARGERALAELERDLQGEGLAVGLAAPTRAARAAARARGPRLAGVRMITSADGVTILVGRTGRDNDALTFKIAAPDDLWLHAAGVAGAHVVIRSPGRGAAIAQRTMLQAAALAAWFSDARDERLVDVHWTRRKNVRRARGGGPGRVTLKRFETLRVAPEPPQGET